MLNLKSRSRHSIISPVKDITIAIDGFAGCGKSTTARMVADRLNYLYIDSGAMYRAVSLYFLRHQVPFEEDNNEIKEALDNIYIDFQDVPGRKQPVITLNGREVESEIRMPEISGIVSQVSVHADVRRELVLQQQRLGEASRVVMDGRDIGTVVFPNAELKVFMTASIEVRAMRRKAELDRQGVDASLSEIMQNLAQRDLIDTTRAIAPLRQASDAILIDTSNISIEQQVDKIYFLARERMED